MSFTGPGFRGSFQVFQEFQGCRIPQLQGAVGCKVPSDGIVAGVPLKFGFWNGPLPVIPSGFDG